ncbi:MAG: hypothetical protein WCH34_09280 [Bacteroidota bacterium]
MKEIEEKIKKLEAEVTSLKKSIESLISEKRKIDELLKWFDKMKKSGNSEF